ncbi:MAG TPA: serine hydrolase domain-containing protein [Ohtaekwangia sp.]|nr:serine hydrolase domain-containing protein [Ohtaekwangia sp.]
MKKHTRIFVIITILFIIIGFIVKSKYYYVPYPNLIEYILAVVLLVITFFSLFGKKHIEKKQRIATGMSAIVMFMMTINLLNYIFEWHPLDLKVPFAKSQSFEVDFEPYSWETASPETYGYNNAVLDNFFEDVNAWDRLRGLIVVKDGKLIIEKYFAGTTRYSAFNVHSVTKSITSALVGLSIQHNFINSEHELVMPFFSEYTTEYNQNYKGALTIKHLLSMRGGWAGWDGHQTAVECIVDEKLDVMPDSTFKYFTGSQNILSAIITKTTNQSTREFADQYLFKPLGIQNGFWRKVGGYYCGGDESYYTARDLARIGSMYLNKGNVDGVHLLDSIWVRKSFVNYTTASNEFRSLDAYDEVGYGFCWWIFKTKAGHLMYAARGKGGQHVVLIPNKNIVVVILQEWNPLKKNAKVEDKLIGDLLKIL